MDPMRQAKRPVTQLAGAYGHPLHPALVAVPIGAWTASFVFDVASHVVAAPEMPAQASRWLIALGVLGALAAACFGFLDLLAIPTGTRAFRTALIHMSVNLAATGAFGLGFALRAGAGSGPVPAGPLAVSVLALAAVGVAGYLGGKLAYRYGVRVADESTQAEGFIPTRTKE